MNRLEYLEHREEFISAIKLHRPAGAEIEEKFEEELRAKMDRGRALYGDASYNLPIRDLLDEVQEECIDIPGWLAIVYSRMRTLGCSEASCSDVVRMAIMGYDAYVAVELQKRSMNI